MKFNFNLNIQKLSLFLIVFNILTLLKELPSSTTGFALSALAFSFFIQNKKLRLFFKITLLVSGIFLV